MQAPELSPKNDRLLNTKGVLEEIYNNKIHHATLRRMWQRGEIPPPFPVGGQNCWYESTLKKVLAEKQADALRRQAEILSQAP
jgi:protein involved in temperature-dependent protein secretion